MIVKNNSDDPWMAQHVVVLGSGEPIIPDTPLPTQLSQSFVQPFSGSLHSDLLSLDAWFLEP